MNMTPITTLATPASGILVPLDGSTRSEGALPLALNLARMLQRQIVLARVISLLPLPPGALGAPIDPDTYQRLLDDERSGVQAYLERQAQTFRQQGVNVETVVEQGEPGDGLLDICAHQPIGLIIMASHGRAGIVRAALGSIADRLVRLSHYPVLLVHGADGQDVPSFSHLLHHLVIPLDGSPTAESALPIATVFAGRIAREITLLQVMSYTADASEHLATRSYLEDQAESMRKRIEGRSCEIDTAIRYGDILSEEILQYAKDHGGLLVMTTRGRSGLSRFVLGSVADEVIRGTTHAVLVACPQ